MEIAAVIWINDDPLMGGIIRLKDISSPRKEIHEYREGDSVIAPCRGFKGKHPCILAKIGDKTSKAELEALLLGQSFKDLLEKYNVNPKLPPNQDENHQPSDNQEKLTNFQPAEKTQNPEMHVLTENNSHQNKKQKRTSEQKNDDGSKNYNKNLENVAQELALTELGNIVRQSNNICNNEETASKRQRIDSQPEETIKNSDNCCMRNLDSVEREVANLQNHNAFLNGEVSRLWQWINIIDSRQTEILQQQQNMQQQLQQLQQGQLPSLVQQQPFIQQSQQQQIHPKQQHQPSQQSQQQLIESPQEPAEPTQQNECKTYGGYTKAQLISYVAGVTDSSKAAKKLFRRLYNDEEVAGRSLTGGKSTKRPGLADQSKLEIIFEIMREQYGAEEAYVRFRLRDILKPSRNSHGEPKPDEN